MNNRRCGYLHFISTFLKFVLLGVLAAASTWAQAVPVFTNPTITPTSGTVAPGGKLVVSVGGTVRGGGLYESVYYIQLMKGTTELAAVEFTPLEGPNGAPVNETRQLYHLVGELPEGVHDLHVIATSTAGTKETGKFTITVTASAPANGARLVSTNIALPSTVEAGRTYPYEVVMQNTGTETWAMSGSYPYSLGSQNPQDNYNWGKARLPIPNNVAPGAQVTIRGNLTAPLAAASYNFAWRMVKDMAPNGWFGDTVSQPAITVQRTKPSLSFSAPSTTSCTPSSGNSCTVTFVGNGTAVSDFSMSSVELYVAGSRIGSGTSSVSATHTLTGIGNHTIELRGTDSRGVQGSTYMTFTVRPPAPTAILTGPADYSTFQIVSGTTYPITLTGSSSATSPATLTNVTIKHDLLGVRTDSYTVSGGNLNLPLNLPPGFHIIYMTATDSYGNTSTSNYLHFTVNAPTPSVSMSAPSAATSKVTATGSALVRFTGSASTPGGTMKRIELVDLSQKVWATINFASGTSGTFDQDVSLPVGEYTMRFKAFNSYDAWAYSGSVNVSVIAGVNGNGARFVSQSVPSSLRPGEPYNATVTMMNNGTTTWSEGQSYRLGAQKTQDNRTWISTARAYLASSVAPGQSYTFTLPITAPQKVGAYDFQWQMVQDGAGWFGALTDLRSVTVASGTGPTAALNVSPTNSRVGAQGYTTLTFSGNGERSGGVVSKLELLEDSGAGFGAAVASNTGGSSSLVLSTSLNRTAGIYKFKLRATDSSGLKTDSEIVTVNVVNSPLLGTVKGVRSNATGAPELYGWVCEPGKPAGLNYQVLLDTPSQATGGTVLTTGVANVGTEPDNAAVQSSCSTTGSPHHFVVNLSSYLAQYAGRSLYVVAGNAAGANPIALPCADNSCTMPGTQRVVVATPQTNDKIAVPNPVFMRMQLTNYSGGLDEVGFVVNGEFIPALPDGAGYYAASKSGLAAGRYPVFARVRQGRTTIQSVENQFEVVQGNTVTLTSPANNASISSGTQQTLQATVAGYRIPASVKFFVNGALVANGTDGGANWSANWTPSQVGMVSVVARSYDGNNEQIAESAAILVNVALPNGSSETPLPVVVDVPHSSNSIAGTLPGSLAVGNDGAATYSVELVVPPGSAGMQPRLALNYSSNGSNGMMGLGWSLGGLSTIHRCSKTIAIDRENGRINFDQADRLCLDNMRLVLVNGSVVDDASYWAPDAEYRTEIESFRRISRQADGNFKVEGKDGLIHYYGTSNTIGTRQDSSSRIAAQGRADGQLLVWALARTEDRSGNYLMVEYNQDAGTGEYTPKQISYGGNTAAAQPIDLAVRFEYDKFRTDAQVQFMGGSRNDLLLRLTNVQTFIHTTGNGTGGTLVRDVKLGYRYSVSSGRSLVESIEACLADGKTCLPKTEFAWGQDALAYRFDKDIVLQSPRSIDFGTPVYDADLDGDGLPDRILAGRTVYCPIDPTCKKVPGENGGNENPMSFFLNGQLDIYLSSGARIQTQLKMADGLPFPVNRIVGLIISDLDGDGRDDMALDVRWRGPSHFCLNQDLNSLSCQKMPATPTSPIVRDPANNMRGTVAVDTFNNRRGHFLVDMDMDCFLGSDNKMQCMPVEAVNTTSITGYLNPLNMPSFSPTQIDFSKRGMSDLYSISKFVLGSGIDPRSGVATCVNKPAVDGKLRFECQTVREWNGTATIVGAKSVGDLNGDALSDFLYEFSQDSIYVCLGKENGADCQTAGRSVSLSVNDMHLLGDFTGDGSTNVLVHRPRDNMANASVELCRMTYNRQLNCTPLPYTKPAVRILSPEWRVVDGGGIPRLLYFASSTDSNGVSLYTYKAYTLELPASQDRLTKVTNGVGYVEKVEYARGNDTNVYQRTATVDGKARKPIYPQVSVTPGAMVKQLSRSNGADGWLDTTYSYAGAMSNASGRGSIGFTVVKSTDKASSITTTTQFSQDFPYAGMPERVCKSVGECPVPAESAPVLEYSAYTLGKVDFTFASGAQSFLPHVKQVVTTRRDLDGSPMGTTSTVNVYSDNWGNANVQTVTVTSGAKTFSTKTESKFMVENGLHHQAGLPTKVTVSKWIDSEPAVVRSVDYSYDPTTALRITETIEKGDSKYELLTVYDRTGNKFGLVSKQTQSWRDPACNDPYWPESGCRIEKSRTVSETEYEKGRFPLTAMNALGHSESYAYDDATGVRTRVTDANGQKTFWTVDGFGRISSELRPDGNQTRHAWKRCGADDCPARATVIQITEHFNGNSRSAVPQLVYLDSAGHVLRTQSWGFDGRVTYVDQRYDSRGRLFETDQPRFASKKVGESSEPVSYLASRQFYDDLNRVTNVVTLDELGLPRSATTKYRGLTTELTNLLEKRRIEQRNGIGQLTQVTDANQKNTLFEYDPFGNLIKTTDPSGNVIKVGYDRLGRKIQLNDPDLGVIDYFVDPLGQTWAQQSPKQTVAKRTRMAYDLLGRMTARYESDSGSMAGAALNSFWKYDTATNGKGLLAEAFTGAELSKDYQRLHTYDDKGRPKTTTQRIQGMPFTSTMGYDSWGRPVSYAYRRDSNGIKTFGLRYNANGYLERVERGGLVLWRVTEQDAAARARSLALGNTLTQTRSYDPYTGRLTGAVLVAGTAKRLTEGYTYDLIGNMKSRIQSWDVGNFSEQFDYDALNRLTRSEVAGKPAQVFDYYDNGNMKYKGSATNVYSYPEQGAGRALPHAVQTVAGIAGTFSYDANGNLISGAGRTICWNSFDMPIKIAVGGNPADCSGGSVWSSFSYGSEHQRTRQERSDGTVLHYAGAQEVEVKGTSVKVKTYWPQGIGLEIDKLDNSEPQLLWTHADRLGSIVAYSDKDGVIQEPQEYDAWGKRRKTADHHSTPNDLDGERDNKGFTGHEMLDQLDLVHMNGRIYDPLIGKFLSADPMISEPTDGQNYNRYSYVLNNPTNLTDPTGFAQKKEEKKERPNQKEIEEFLKRCENGCLWENADGTWTPIKTTSGARGGASDRGENAANQGADGLKGIAIGALKEFGSTIWNADPGLNPAMLVARLGTGDRSEVDALLEQHGTAEKAGGWALFGASFLVGAGEAKAGASLLSKINPCKCFVAGTLVHTKDGIKPIEAIEVGDLVAARSDVNGRTEWKSVLSLIRFSEKNFVKVHYRDEAGDEESLVVTLEHPFMLEGNRWVQAGDLKTGNRAMRLYGEHVTVLSVSELAEERETYNFEVADFHTYFVGMKGVWVHNACDLSKLPIQEHHFATHINKKYKGAMSEIAEKYGLDLNGAWNKGLVPHRGRHPDAYHEFVLDAMKRIDKAAAGSQAKFIELFNLYVKEPVRKAPEMLRKEGW